MKVEAENTHIQRGNQLTTRRISHKKGKGRVDMEVSTGPEFVNIYGLFQLPSPPAHKSLMKN